MPFHRRHTTAAHTRQTPLRVAITRLRTLVRGLVVAERGNVLVTFAFSLIPLLGMVGAAIDYSRAARVRTQMLAAADAAALGAVAKSSPAIKAATTMTSDGPIPVGVEDAKKIFNGQLPSTSTYENLTVTATVVKAGSSVDSVVQFSANVPTMILGILALKDITVAGVSKASATLPIYIDFHLLLDNTPSMGVGATTADINKMVANTGDKCAFACHDKSAPGKDYYSLAKKLGVQMRIDVMRTATQQLMDTAQSTQVFPGQFRVAIHTFGADAKTNFGLTTVQSVTSDLSTAKNSAAVIDLMTVEYQNYKSDTLTDFHDVVADVDTAVGNSGNGSTSALAQKILFFVSDGVADRAIGNPACSRSTTKGQDPKTKTNYVRCQEPFDPNLCEAMKKRGVKIAVLYTTYLPLPTNDWYNDWIKPFQSQIGTKMQSCATSGLYFEVSPSDGSIPDAMKKLFEKAISEVRLTQ